MFVTRVTRAMILEKCHSERGDNAQRNESKASLLDHGIAQPFASIPDQMSQAGDRVISERKGQQKLESEQHMRVNVVLQELVNLVKTAGKVERAETESDDHSGQSSASSSV